jgi:hypothetical protein
MFALTALEETLKVGRVFFQGIVVFLESLKEGLVTVLAEGCWIFAPGALR